MRGCLRCAELDDSLEHLVVKYWATVERNRQLASTDPDKRDAETIETTAKNAMDEAWKLFEDHKKGAHPHVVLRD